MTDDEAKNIDDIGAAVRVSTHRQLQQRAHLRQRKRIAEWAERRGLDPGDWDSYHTGTEITDSTEWDSIDGETTGDITWYEDLAVSGQSDERDGYNRLMGHDDYDAPAYPQHDGVVVRELSRFGRDPQTIMRDVEEIIDESDTEFISITEAFDTTSAMGKAMLRFTAVMNGLYSDLARERAERMHERRKEQGLPVGRHKKLDDKALEDVYEWREKGLSHGHIATLVEEVHGTQIDRSTIYRYCDEAGIEPNGGDA